jgi:uncharacterized protein
VLTGVFLSNLFRARGVLDFVPMPSLLPHSWFVVVVVALLGFAIGFSKGGFTGLGVLLTPLLSLVLPNVALAVGVLLPMLLVGDVFVVYSYWGKWDGHLVRQMLPGALVGVALGTLLLAYLPANVMRWALAIFTLLMVVYKFASEAIGTLRYEPRAWHSPVVGSLAGLGSAMFNNGGPVFNSYLLLQNAEPRLFIANSVLFFALLNVIKVPGFLYARVLDIPLLLSFWWVFPFIPVGIWAARQLVMRIKPSVFEWLIIVLLIISSGLLIWQTH